MSGEYVYDPFDDIYGNGNMSTQMTKYCESDFIADALKDIGRWEASGIVRNSIFLLDSYVDSDNLFEMFDWKESRQGYDFWCEVFNELVSVGEQDYPPEVLKKLEASDG